MSQPSASGRPVLPLRAPTISTRRQSLRAGFGRLLARWSQALDAWRRDRHDARYMGYLSDRELKEIGLTRSGFPTIDIGRCSERQRFPF